MKDDIRFVAMDVHADTVAVSLSETSGEVRPGFPRYSSLHSTLSGGVFSHLIESVIPEARPLQALVTALSIAALRDPEAAVRQMVCPP